MSESTELLEFIYKNTEMGVKTLPLVIGSVSRPDLRTALSQQLTEYRAIGREAENMLHQRGAAPKPTGGLKQSAIRAGLELDLLARGSTRRVAEMMIRGNTMGAVQMGKRMHAYQYTADGEALELAGRLLRTEENNIAQMRSFL